MFVLVGGFHQLSFHYLHYTTHNYPHASPFTHFLPISLLNKNFSTVLWKSLVVWYNGGALLSLACRFTFESRVMRSWSLFPQLLDHRRKPARAWPHRPGHGLPIDCHQAKLWPVALVPLKIIKQTPV